MQKKMKKVLDKCKTFW